jgi:hypothetical protein
MLKDKTKLLLYVLLTSPVIAVLKVTSSFRLYVLLKFMLHGLVRLTSGSLVCVLFMFIVWDHTPWTHSQHFSIQETPWITQGEDPRTWARIFKLLKEPRNRFQVINSASLSSRAGRYDNPIPTRFLAPIDCLKFQLRFLLPWGRILGRNWDKSLRSFPPCYSVTSSNGFYSPHPWAKVVWNWSVW